MHVMYLVSGFCERGVYMNVAFSKLETLDATVFIDPSIPVEAILLKNRKIIIAKSRESLTRFVHDFYGFSYFKHIGG